MCCGRLYLYTLINCTTLHACTYMIDVGGLPCEHDKRDAHVCTCMCVVHYATTSWMASLYARADVKMERWEPKMWPSSGSFAARDLIHVHAYIYTYICMYLYKHNLQTCIPDSKVSSGFAWWASGWTTAPCLWLCVWTSTWWRTSCCTILSTMDSTQVSIFANKAYINTHIYTDAYLHPYAHPNIHPVDRTCMQ